jgi:tetratricopeptide (TPR) repeat protein
LDSRHLNSRQLDPRPLKSTPLNSSPLNSPSLNQNTLQNPHLERIQQLDEILMMVQEARVRMTGWQPEKFWQQLGGALFLRLDEKKKIAGELKNMPLDRIVGLIQNFDLQAVRFSRKLGADLFQKLTEAVCAGRLDHYADIDGADAEALRTGIPSFRVIARLAIQDSGRQSRLLKEVEQILPNVRSPHVWLLWANRIKKLPGSQKRLEWAYSQIRNLGDHDAYSWNDYANLLVEYLNRADEAEAAYYLSIELDQKFALPWHNLGKLLKDRKRFDESEVAFRKAIEINPKYASAWKSLGSLLQYQLHRHAEAAAAYRKVLEIEPASANTWHDFGCLLADNLNKPAEAEKAYRKAVKLNPNNPSYLNNLAWQLYLNNRGLDEAEQFARRSVNSGPEKDLINVHTLACILMRRGIWDEAVKYALAFIRQGNDALHKEAWPEIVMFFRDAVGTGHTNEALRLIDEAACGENWRPMREALQAISRDDSSYVAFLAPQLRRPVQDLINLLLPDGIQLSNPKIRQKQRTEPKTYNFEADIRLFVPDQQNEFNEFDRPANSRVH